MSIVLVKNNKGGLGKSLLTLFFAAAKAKEGKQCLILTGDSQNNIFNFAGVKKPENMYALEDAIRGVKKDFYALRENLFFLPLRGTHIKSTDKEHFQKYVSQIKKDFDYILIDGSPVMHLDEVFLEIADHILIPTFLDQVTTDSVLTMIRNVDFAKIRAVIPNRAGRTKVEKEYFNSLKFLLKKTGILVTMPISQSSVIGKLIEKGKTAYDSTSSKLLPLKGIIQEVWEAIEDE